MGNVDDRSLNRLRRIYHVPVMLWTVKTPEDRAAAAGFEGVIFEGAGRPAAGDETP